jgi:hypothetical protein
MSSMSCACRRALRVITSTAWRARSGVSPSLCSRCTQPMIALSGVRSSCDSTARNSSFARLASSAAASRASSASLRRVTIMQTPLMRTGRPCSYSTRPLPSTQRTVPSGATMRYSTSWGTPSSSARWIEARPWRGRRGGSPARSWRRCRRRCRAAGRGCGRGSRTRRRVRAQVPVPGAHPGGVEREAQALFAAPGRLLGRVRSTRRRRARR